MNNPHWDQFLADVPWVLEDAQDAEAGRSAPPGAWAPASPDFARLFPQLHRLLKEAVVTPVALAGARHHLYSWSGADGYDSAWLSPLPSAEPPSRVFLDHQILLGSFGGIVERSNEPQWWLLNHNDALTEREARHDATFIRDCSAAFGEAGIPIRTEDFYSIAREANGNTTLCHRLSGEVLLFAHDHSFDYVQPLAGCPEYTLYRMRGAPTFPDWVNEVARQWHDAIEA